jgi:glutathione S-transferase
VARFQVVYLGKPARDLDPNLVKRGYAALDQLEQRLRVARFLLGESFSLADVALLAYTRVAHEGGFDLGRQEAVRRWIGDCETHLGLSPAR